jgi:aspartate aminotransferase
VTLAQRILEMEESPTLAVTAKAKALKAAGEPVIGFGAGEPDFPTPPNIVEAAQRAADGPGDAPLHPDRRPPRPARGHRREDQARLGPGGLPGPGRGRQRRQARALQRLHGARRRGRRGADPCALLGELPRAGQARRWRPGRRPDHQGDRIPHQRRAARGAPHRGDEGVGVRLPVQPDRRGLPAGGGRRDRRWAAEHGIWVITDEIYEHLIYGEATAASLPVVAPEAAARTVVVNGSPRPTR